MTNPEFPPELLPLPIPVPPDLVTICGYPKGRDARFVALYWNGGDEVFYDDGQISGTGASFVFLAYRRHPAVACHLEQYNIGYSDLEADDYLLIDRDQDQAYVAPVPVARTFLHEQHPPPPELSPYQQQELARDTQEFLNNINQALSEGWIETKMDPNAVREHMRQEQATITRLIAWLDQQPNQGERP